MTEQDRFDELKELFLQSEQRIRRDFKDSLAALEARMDKRIDALDAKMMDGFAGVAGAIETVYEYVDGRFISKPRWLRAKT